MGNIAFDFFMSPLTHLEDIRENEKTKLCIVYHQHRQTSCVLRICKNRDLSAVCEALCKIRNPGAVVVYDYVYENGDTYILEEKLDGRTLAEIMEEEGLFAEDRTARIMIEVCKALEDLHREQPPIIHNDINTSNIMICEDGRVKLFDFDISRLYRKGQNRNTTLFGTEEYASPEHYGYGQSEPRTDIYCMGVTMHKMLTDKGLTNEHRMTYRGRLRGILRKCLAFDPKNRYASVGALKRDLERFLSRKKRTCRKICGILAAALLIAGAVTGIRLFDEPSADAPANAGDHAEVGSSQNTAQELPSEPRTNDSRTTAQALDLNQEYQEGIEVGGVPDWYCFQTTERVSVYRIWLQSQLDTYCISVKLYDEIGTIVDRFDVYPSHEKENFLDLYLKAGEKYSIQVSAADIVDYRICVSERVCDAGTDQDSATEILPDQQHFAIANSTLADWYVFEAPEEGSYVVTCHNIDVGASIKGEGTGYWGTAEHEDNFSHRLRLEKGEQVCFRIYSTRAEANGTYMIEITSE